MYTNIKRLQIEAGWYMKAQSSNNLEKEADLDWRVPAAAAGAAAIGLGSLLHHKPQTPAPSTPTKQVEKAPSSSTTESLPSMQDVLKGRKEKLTTTAPSKTEQGKTPSVEKNTEMDAIMHAIHMMESSGGVNNKPRYEPAFEKNYVEKCLTNKNYQTPQYQFARDLVKAHGKKAAATSYGPYQVMLFEAWQLGFRVSPAELSDPAINKKVATAYVKSRSKGKSAYDTFLKYNGSPDYADKAMKYYEQYKAKHK